MRRRHPGRRRIEAAALVAVLFVFFAVPAAAAEAYHTVAVIDYPDRLSADDAALTHAVNTTLAYRIESLPLASLVSESELDVYLQSSDVSKLWNMDKPAAREFGRLSKADLLMLGRHWKSSPGLVVSEFRVIYMPLDDTVRTSKLNIKLSPASISTFQSKLFDKVAAELPLFVPKDYRAGGRLIASAEAFRQFGNGLRHIAAHRPEAGLAALEKALKAEPAARDIHYFLGRYFATRQYDYDAAVRHMERITSENGGDADAWYWLGFTYYVRADYAAALKAFERSKSVQPGSVETLLMLGLLYNDTGDYDSVVDNYRAALKLAPHRASIWYSLTAALSVIGRTDEALTALRRTLELDRDGYYDLARTDYDLAALRKTREYREMIERFKP